MRRVGIAEGAVLLVLDAPGLALLILRRVIISPLAFSASEDDDFSGHGSVFRYLWTNLLKIKPNQI